LRLRRFVAPHWRVLVLGLALLAGVAAMDLLTPWPLKIVFDNILGKPLEGANLRLLILVAVAVVAIPAIEGLFSYLLVYFLNRAGRVIVFDIRAALFDHVQRLSLQYHSRRSTGDLLARLTSDTKQISSVFTDWMADLLNSTLFVFGMGVVLIVLDWQLGLITIASMPILFVALRRFAWRIREFSRQERAREGALATIAHEALGTVKLSHAFGYEEIARRRFQHESAESLRSGVAAALNEERFGWVTDVLAGAAVAAVLFVGTKRVADGGISPGTLIVFVSYARAFYKPMRSATKNATRITRAVASVERVLELLEVKEGITDAPGAREAPPLRGKIAFRNVSFAYDAGEPVLEDVTLDIPAGKVTAVVGPTGAGKSTLTALIPRLYDPNEGAVLVDGVDVREYTVRSLRAQVSVVLQESVLLSASIAENIAYGRPSARFVEIVAAAKAASADGFIRELPQGYDTIIGERGETLSGGQRQRIAIARALLRDAPILILDEPLAGLDVEAAAAVLDGVRRRSAGKTLIVITHDPALAAQADEVVVVDGGHVAQSAAPLAEAVT
jgi:ABC-type multidrug transport system fused ATPase/permease subunit